MSPMIWIIMLIVLGLILFFAELVILPGITVAAVGAFCCLVAAVAWSFAEYGLGTGFTTLAAVMLLIVVMLIIFLRPRTWNSVALKTEISESIDIPIEELVTIDSCGKSLTRLAPMGKVLIEGRTYEAKTMGEYLDEGSIIKVIGYDNQNIIVESFNNC